MIFKTWNFKCAGGMKPELLILFHYRRKKSQQRLLSDLLSLRKFKKIFQVRRNKISELKSKTNDTYSLTSRDKIDGKRIKRRRK